MTTYKQLIEVDPDRTTYIGSTDARTIATGDWLDLYFQKTGETPGPDLSHVFKVQLGLASEDLHRNFWRWQGNSILNVAQSPQPYRVDNAGVASHHATSLDGWWLTGDQPTPADRDGISLELKHTHGGNDLRSAAEFYMAQIQWQMWCTDTHAVMFSIIAGNQDPQRALVSRDDDYIAKLVDQVDVFWACVQERTPPSFSVQVAATEQGEVLKVAAGSVLIDGRKPYDWEKNNQWVDVATRYVDEKRASDRFKKTDKELRALIPADASVVTGGGLTMKRDARGAFRCTIKGDSDGE